MVKSSKSINNFIGKFVNDGVKFAQIQVPDINGRLRGKMTRIENALNPCGMPISSVQMCLRSCDYLCKTPFTSIDNGYPKITAIPDYATAKKIAWQPDMIAVLCDQYMNDGEPCQIDGRQTLKRASSLLKKYGFEAKAALEYEVYVYESDDELLRVGNVKDLKSFGRHRDFFSLNRFPGYEDLAKEFIDRMAAIDIEVVSFHTEYGRGMLEYSLGVSPLVKAADDAVRAKLYFKQLCNERGLISSYMPTIKCNHYDSFAGAHHNISLWSEGKNSFWDPETRTLSTIARRFAAGMLETLPDLCLLFRPWMNSIRRTDTEFFTPVNVSWGLDNHTVAVRVVHSPLPEKYSRLEHRVSGPDVNPYLTLAGIILGGVHGLENELEPPEYVVGNARLNDHYPLLPVSFNESIQKFRCSDIAQKMFGKLFIEQYSSIKEQELEAYNIWCGENGVDPVQKDNVTDWEYEHYFEWV